MRPYVPNTNAFLCPAKKANPSVYDSTYTYIYDPNKMVSGYEANFQVGGCQFNLGDWYMAPIIDSAAVRPSPLCTLPMREPVPWIRWIRTDVLRPVRRKRTRFGVWMMSGVLAAPPFVISSTRRMSLTGRT